MRFLAAALVALSATSAIAEVPSFSADRIEADVAFLADDALEGREAGTRGYDLAALFVESRMRALGLKPSGDPGSYLQKVNFVRYRENEDVARTMTIGDKVIENRDGVLVGSSPLHLDIDGSAPAVFVGRGLVDPTFGYDDYEGLDVEGKIVVTVQDIPEELPADVAAHLRNSTSVNAAKRGAIGMVSLWTPAREKRFAFERMTKGGGRDRMTLADADGKAVERAPELVIGGVISGDTAPLLFEGSGHTWDEIVEALEKGTELPRFALSKSIGTRAATLVEPVSSHNVIGMIEGSDPVLKNEVVLLTAHLDHLGVRERREDDEEGADLIFNGAMDNASGVATMLEAARAFATSDKRPRRSVAFAALTGEEKGLLGAEHLASNLPFDEGMKLVGTVNLDMPILTYDYDDIVVYGADHSTLIKAVEKAVAEVGVKVVPDPQPQQGFFVRSDHYRFVQKGYPAVSFDPGPGGDGAEKSEDFLEHHYHEESDDMSLPIDWEAGAKFARMNYLIAREMADADEAPLWYADSFFGNAVAPDAPKAER
ncbi:M28 family metallopeptidase [Sphingomicrobium nitratireducens]|uniref:M28 family metallopeptidase n=1 Tax=Sphingomicrobium nitratireducens TaxID=2964666 RepID=UPI00223F62DB|nr:M28 family metallopeptidase [Sphingomicrobium nitratireducens]